MATVFKWFCLHHACYELLLLPSSKTLLGILTAFLTTAGNFILTKEYYKPYAIHKFILRISRGLCLISAPFHFQLSLLVFCVFYTLHKKNQAWSLNTSSATSFVLKTLFFLKCKNHFHCWRSKPFFYYYEPLLLV